MIKMVFRMSCKLKNKQPRLSKHAVEQHSNDCKQEFIERSKQDDTSKWILLFEILTSNRENAFIELISMHKTYFELLKLV